MPKDCDTLFGVAAIRPHVGNASEATIMKWKIEYPSFPIRKLRGVWVANKETLVEWFRRFCVGEVEPIDNRGEAGNDEKHPFSSNSTNP